MHSLRSLPARMIMRFRPLVLALLALAALPAIADADSWTRTGSLVTGRLWQTVTLLPSGQVLAAGGSSFSPFDSIGPAAWNPASGAWSTAASFPTARHQQAASLLQDGRVLMTGGRISGAARGILNSWLAYDPATGTWSTPAAMPNPHSNHVQVTLQDGRVLVAGGFRTDGSQLASNEVEIFDPASGTWRAGESLPNPVANATATLLRDGSVLVAGGTSSEVARSDAVRYFPATDEWRRAGSFTDARSTHVAALLPDGNVLIAGGDARANYLRSAAVYDPATNGWTDVAPMAVARDEATAAPLANGKVLVIGGAQGSSYLKTAELFDPAANTWSPAASLGATRGRSASTLLADGRVLAVGGEGIESDARTITALSSAEIYTPDGWPFNRGGGGGGGGGTGGSGPSTPPSISRLALSATRFRAAGSGPSVTAAARRRRAPVGTTVSYRDAAAATATLTVLRPTTGRKSGGRCARPTRANRRRARCTRWTTVGRFTHADSAGPNSLRFSGRVNGHKLSPGRYRLAVIASVGGHSPPGASDDIGFRIVR